MAVPKGCSDCFVDDDAVAAHSSKLGPYTLDVHEKLPADS